MGNDELNPTLPNDEENGKETQPTIAAVFRLLQNVESGVNARFDETEARLNARLDKTDARLDEMEAHLNARLDKTDARLDGMEALLVRDIEGVNSRMADGFKDLGHKINALNRRALQSEANYEDLFDRVGRLESKASLGSSTPSSSTP